MKVIQYKEGLKVSCFYDNFDYIIGILSKDAHGNWWLCQNNLREVDILDTITNSGGNNYGYNWSCRLTPKLLKELEHLSECE